MLSMHQGFRIHIGYEVDGIYLQIELLVLGSPYYSLGGGLTIDMLPNLL